jgi:hypothetical protein
MSTGPEYDSPGAFPEAENFDDRADFLAAYPGEEELADEYFPID